MNKLIGFFIVIAIAVTVAWQNRVDLLVWGLPIVRQVLSPVPENVPTTWPAGPELAAAPANERPPNIILILTDDMGFNDVSLYNGGAGDGSVMTPNIDAIAKNGVKFTNGYSANAVCAPSRASIMTGRYSTRFGFEFTPFFKIGAQIFSWMEEQNPGALPTFIDLEAAEALPDMSKLGMPTEEITIAEVLKDAGYYTAHIGKWHLGATNGMRPEDQGFDDSLYMAGTLYLPEDHPDVVNSKLDSSVEQMVWATAEYAAQWNGGERFQPDGYLTDYFSNEAVKVIESNRNQPFFLYLAHWGIHNPIQALKSDYDAFSQIEDPNLRTYSAMIRALDRGVGQVMDALEANGIADNTIVVLTSDNGGAAYIELSDINKPYRGWKLNHFEGGIHVPFMASWPNQIAAGTEVDTPIHHIDIFHTLAGAAGAAIPADRTLDGINFLPKLTGETELLPARDLFWREGHQQSVLSDGWKLIRAESPTEPWLFHLSDDPTEQNNVASKHPEKVKALEALLAVHNAEQAAPMWPSILNAPQFIDKHSGQVYEPGDEYIYWPN
jgi:arylsulfatase A-like enzyme